MYPPTSSHMYLNTLCLCTLFSYTCILYSFEVSDHNFCLCNEILFKNMCVHPYLHVDITFRFIISDHTRTLSLECISESDKERLAARDGDNGSEYNDKGDESTSQPYKKQKLSNSEKKRLRGQNKARPPPFKHIREMNLCPTLIDISESEELPICSNPKCSFLHDVSAYLAAKSPDLSSMCYVYSTQGRCPRGASCRYKFSCVSKSGKLLHFRHT